MDQKATHYDLPIELGATYEDPVTGFTGVATSVCFSLTGTPSVALEGLDDRRDLRGYRFDWDRLEMKAGAKGNIVDIRERTAQRELITTGGAH